MARATFVRPRNCARAIIAFDTKGADFRWKSNCRKTPGIMWLQGFDHRQWISLTVAEVLPRSFAVWIIPYTKRHTNLDRVTVAIS